MPIDPSIALSGRPVPMPDPMESYAKLMQIQSMQQQQAMQKESLGALAEERQARAAQQRMQLETARQGQQASSAAQQAIDLIQSGKTDEALAGLNVQARGMVQDWLLKQQEFSAKREALKAKDFQESAQLIRALGYDPTIAEGVFLMKGKDDPQVADVWQQIQGDPDKLKRVVDHFAGVRDEKAAEGFTLAPGATRYDAHAQPIATAPARPEAPKGKWVPDYDENSKPIERWMAEGPGAVVPRQEAPVVPPRPLVLGQGAKAIDPATGAVIAEGNAPPVPPVRPTAVPTVNDAGQPVTKFVEPTAGQEFLKQPEPEKLTRPREVKPGSEEAFFIAFAKKLGKRPDDLSLDELAKARQAWSRADDKPPISKDNPLWVWRDGRPVRLTEGEIRPGDSPRPTEGAEKKRAVTSGDAGKLADFDTSLSELKAVRGELSAPGAAKATGYSAKAGAMAPNIVTELTGIGAEAKAKQATIDRVKQVIGKTLEGGVLRKEDEAKYEKILPTIGDPPSVVAAKLNGLERAIAQRKQVHLDALADAGYDVSRFVARTPTAPAGPKIGDKVGRFEIVGVK